MQKIRLPVALAVGLCAASAQLAYGTDAVPQAGALNTAPAPEQVERWTPQSVSSELFESHAAFDPKSGELYFVRSSRSFSGWRILTAHCEAHGWSVPHDAPFAGKGVEADPYFTPDGRSVYFISTRATGSTKSQDLDIWKADRSPDGSWAEPVRLPAPVNSAQAEWFPRPGPDGWLYFGSNRPGGLGKNDIWRAKESHPGSWTVENLGPTINTAGDEYEALPSPDGKLLILNADGGMFVSSWGAGRWSPRTLLGPAINVNGSEIGALFSPSGRSLMFARDTGEPLSGEFFVWRLEGHEPWPPACPLP
jgi:hypothetical protein